MVLLFEGVGKDCEKYRFTGRIRDNVRINFEEYIILKNGERLTPDYNVREDDIIYIRKLPKGATAAVVMAVVGLVAAVGAGVYSYIQQKKINDMNEKLQENQRKLQAGSQVNKLPYVRGAANRMATGETFPYIIGETLFTPYKLSPDHIEVSGTDGSELFYYLILNTGFSDLVYKKLFLGNAEIKTWAGNAPQNGVYTFDQGAYYDDDNRIELRQTGAFVTAGFEKKIAMAQYMEEIPHRHLPDDATPAEAQEIEDEWRAGLVKQLAGKAMGVEVIIMFDGLRRFDSDTGTWYSQSCTLQVQWTNVSNPQENDWTDFTNGFDQNGTYSNVFTRNVQKQIRFCARQNFTAAQAYGKDISIRVRRTTPKAKENARDTVYLLAVQTTCYGAGSTDSTLVPALPLVEELRDKCSRVGIKVRSTNATDGHLDSFSVIVSGCARTWDSFNHEWSLTKTPTRNLAAWVLEIETSGIHEPSRYSDSEFDLDSFGAWYEYCETMGIYADGAITSSSTKKLTIDTLVANGNAALVYNEFTGKIEVCIDIGRDYCVGLVTPDNILSMNATKQVKRLADGKRVSYVNRDANYETDTITFMRDGGDYDPQSDILSPVSLSFITNYSQAFRQIWRQMAEEIARPLSVTAKLGPMGAFYRLFDCLQVQHPALSIGLGHGTIKMLGVDDNNIIKQIQLAGWVEFPESGDCGIIINCSSTGGVLPVQVTGHGKTNILTLVDVIHEDDPIAPSLGDTLSFGVLNDGAFDYVSQKMLITNIAPANEGCTVTLVPYNDAVYQYGALPEYHTNITPRPEGTTLTLEDVREYVSPSDVGAAVGALEGGTAEVGNPDDITGLSAVAQRDSVSLSWDALGLGLRNTVQFYQVEIYFDSGTTWAIAGTSKTTSFDFMIVRNGVDYPAYPEADDFLTWRFRVKVRSIYNKDSHYTDPEGVDTSTYGTWQVGSPAIETKIVDRTIILQLSTPRAANNREIYGDIRYQVRVRRGSFNYTSVKYWMHDTSNDSYYYLITNDSKLNEERAKDNTWTAGTQQKYDADAVLDSFDTFSSATDSSSSHEYAYCGYTQIIPADTKWKLPATDSDPYAHSDNYYEASAETQDNRYVVASATYTQTMPLYFTDEDHEIYNLTNTPYWFDVRCFNEAGTGSWYSGASDWSSGHDGKQCVALCTNIQDIVKANETAKTAYIEELSAISAHLGEITDGSLFGSLLNFWTLTTKRGATLPRDYIGAFRVGGNDEYLYVEPQILAGQVVGYSITFKVGKFEISSEYSKLNGEFIIQTNEESLERTRLTPYGTYFESRKLPTDNEWSVIAKQDVAGTLTKMVYSENDSLVISNQGISSRRETNCDIGREYLSSNSLVYHFDVDSLDQYGGSGLTVTKATGAPDPVYVDDEDSEHYGINMAPAIIREAPYSEIGKSLYGLYSLEHSLGTGTQWTIDVWIKYVWAEDQELMRVEVGNDVLLIVNETSEPNYNEPQEGEPPYNTDTMDPEGKPYNVAASSGCVLVYNNTHKIQLKDIGLKMETDNWYHIAVVLNNGTLTFMGSSDATLATLNPVVKVDLTTQGSGGTVIFNSGKESFLCDELFIDTTVAETDVKFLEGSSTKIPWAANSYDADYFILNKSNNSRLITNLFDDDLFKQKVQALFSEYNKYEIGFIQEFGGPDDKVPLGWFPCRWQAISRTTYAVLFGVIGTYWGEGDGSTTFNLPDSREISFVGISKCSNPNHYIYDNTEVNPATGTVGNQDHDVYTLGQYKDDQVQQHYHNASIRHENGDANDGYFLEITNLRHTQLWTDDHINVYGAKTASGYNPVRTGTTTHGKRVGVNYIIRAF